MADIQTTLPSLHARHCPAAWTDNQSGTLLARLANSVSSMKSLTATMIGLQTALETLRTGSQSELYTRSELASMFSQIDVATGAQIDLVVRDLTQSKASFTQAGPRMRQQLSARTSECQTGCPYSEAVPVPSDETQVFIGY
jgi:hypothetical protein